VMARRWGGENKEKDKREKLRRWIAEIRQGDGRVKSGGGEGWEEGGWDDKRGGSGGKGAE